MKRMLVIAFSLMLLPVAGEAQVELGLDAGLVLHTGFELGEDVICPQPRYHLLSQCSDLNAVG